MARLAVKVKDSVTGAVLPYVHVDVAGSVLTTSLDGVAEFEVPVCQSVVVKVRHVAYRPVSQSFHATEERRYEIEVSLTKAIL